MRLFLSTTHSDEDGPDPEEGKYGMIYGSRAELSELCDFFQDVKEELLRGRDKLHLHFRDYATNWDRKTDIDIEVNLKEMNEDQ